MNETDIENAVTENFKLTPNGIIESLGLRNPIYRKLYHGHFGRNDVSWELVDEAKQIFAELPKTEKNVKQIDVNVADLSDVQIQGTFVVDEEYYIYERNTEGDTGFKSI